MSKKKFYFCRAVSGLLSALMLLTAVGPMAATAAEASSGNAYPDISEIAEYLEDGEAVTAKDIEIEAGEDTDIENKGIEFNAEKVSVKLYEAKDGSGRAFDHNVPGTYRSVYHCTPKSGNPSYSVRRTITVKEPVKVSEPESSGEGASGSGQEEQESSQDDGEAESEPSAETPADEQTAEQEAADEGTDAEETDAQTVSESEEDVLTEETTEMEEAEETEETEEDMSLLSATVNVPYLGAVRVGRDGRTELPVTSKYVNYTRCWYVIHNGVKYWAVCARASASGAVDPSAPDSTLKKVRYNYLDEKTVNALTAWQKQGENGTTVPITTGLGKNAELAKAVMVSMFIRDKIWEDNFPSFKLSYAAAHLLISDLLYGDDDAATGKNYDLVFKTMKKNVRNWMKDPRNKAILDSCDAYIAFLWGDGEARGRQPVMWMENLPGVLELRKKALDTDGNPLNDMDLTGTVYSVYTDAECKTPAIDLYNNEEAKFVCYEDGTADKLLLPMGTYYVKETAAAEDFALDPKVYEVEIVRTTEFGESINYVLLEQGDTYAPVNWGSLEIQKVDAETVTARGAATLEGAVYELIVNEDKGVTFDGKTYNKGETFATLVTDNAGKADVEKVPVGKYILKETAPSKGYKLNPEEVSVTIVKNKKTSLTGNSALEETIVSAPFRFNKINSNNRPMSDVEFEIKSKDSDEAWTIKTGADGTYDSSKAEDHKTLPYGVYVLTEKECEANKGYKLVAPVEFTVTKDGAMIDLGTFVNTKSPLIGTVLTAEDGTHNVRAQKELVLTDKISYSNMLDYIGKEVTFKGELIDKSNDKVVATAEAKAMISAAEGQAEVTFRFDASAIGGHALVAFETAYDVNGKIIAEHKNKNDRNQTVWFPSIETDARTEATGDNVMPESGSNIIDTVTYHSLEAGKKYSLETALYDAETKKMVAVPGSDELIDFFTEFTASRTGDGTVDVTITIGNIDVNGKTFVVYETLRDQNGNVIAEHKDLTDERQTLHTPKIRTHATDGATGNEIGTVAKTATIVDRVTYENLVPGFEYTLNGDLRNKKTGEPILVGGEPVTASKTFTPDKAKGYVDITFTYDSSLLAGETIVVFENLYRNDIEVAVHADINDKNQTVYLPSVKTTATDVESGSHYGNPLDETTKINDKVELNNLVSGREYALSTVLMDKQAKSALAGGKYQKTVSFTAEAADQTVNVAFDVKTDDVIGKSVVVFETLMYDGKIVAVHTNINDKNQTVEYPSLETTATDSVTHDHVGAAVSGTVTINDRADFTGLKAGKEYTLEAVVYDQETEEPLKDADGNLVTATKTFKPEAASGSVVIEIEIDAALLRGKTVVPFETIYDGKKKVAIHADIHDENQTVYYPEIGTSASDELTGDNVGTSDRKTATFNDKVEYNDIMPGKPYTVKGRLVIKKTGEPFIADGSEVTAEKTFTPESKDGSVVLTFTFDASALKGETVVAYESLWYEDIEIAAHADIEDEAQSVTYPGIKTNASDVTTKDHVGIIPSILALRPVMMTQVTDVVTCEGLITGKEYRVSGVLMNKRTNKPFLDEDGKKITAAKTFTAKTPNDKVELLFDVKSDLLEGETVVVFEDLLHNDVVVAVHNDITDKNQSVSYPEISTSAKDAETNDHMGVADKESTIIDRIMMSGLVKGQEYSVKGSLHMQDSGDVITLKDGSTEIEMTFTAKGEEDSVEMTFVFDSTPFNGKAVTVFEDLYHNGLLVAVHHELDNMNQTVYYPEVVTDASDAMTEDHAGVVAEQTTVVDKVTCRNIIAGFAYKVDGVLMIVPESDDEEAAPLLDKDGNPVTASVSFAAIDGKPVIGASAVADDDTEPEIIPELEVDLEFTFDSSLLKGRDVVVFETLYHKDIKVAAHADIHDERQIVHYPEIGTTAVDGQTKTNIGVISKTAVLEDTVNYRNVIPGKEYEAKGRLVIKSTGEDTGIVSSVKFVPEEKDGSVVVTFTFDSTGFAGDALVAFESLVYNDVELAVHADIEDEGQTVYYPEISTDAEDEATGSNVGLVRENCTITDTVKYDNLFPGKEYEAVGTVYVQETGEPLVDAEGNEITNTVVFTPEKASGEVKVVLTFDASLLAGKTVVCFEDLRYEGVTIAVHHDINDKEQSVFFPEVCTHASDDLTGTQTGTVTENASVTDIVEYKNLVPGSYVACGTVVDAETGDVAVDADGNEIVARTIFANAEMEGSVPVTFTFNAKGFDAKTVVVFQSIYKGSEDDVDGKGILVAEHNDIEDTSEMIFYPGVETDAKDGVTGTHTGRIAEETTVVDVATYKNLIPSTEEAPREYTMKGVLMVKSTGEPLLDKDGNEITAEQTFSPEAADGSVELTFTFDSSLLAGETVVAFERLYENDIEVAAHTDIEDERQSVHYPKIGTKASIGGKKTAQASGKIKLDDVVEYENLVPGTEHTVVGVLMDKNSGKVLKVGGKDVTAKAKFTPETANGTVTVTFTFNASGLGGKSLVAFEYLYINDQQVTCHAEINDEAQTVKLTPPPSTKTGDGNGMFVWAAAAVIALAGAVAVVFVRKKKN